MRSKTRRKLRTFISIIICFVLTICLTFVFTGTGLYVGIGDKNNLVKIISKTSVYDESVAELNEYLQNASETTHIEYSVLKEVFPDRVACVDAANYVKAALDNKTYTIDRTNLNEELRSEERRVGKEC